MSNGTNDPRCHPQRGCYRQACYGRWPRAGRTVPRIDAPTTCWWCHDIMQAPAIQSSVRRPIERHHTSLWPMAAWLASCITWSNGITCTHEGGPERWA